jgi:lysophospholipase L1-like esterase
VLLAAAIVETAVSCEPLSTPDLPAETKLEAPSEASYENLFPFHTVLCFGDSITYGITLQASALPPGSQSELTVVEGYVPKLWRRLQSKYGAGIALVNDAVPGEGSRAAAARIDREMETHAPDLVLLLEGIIDVNRDSPDFPEVRDNLREILRIVKEHDAVLVLGTYPRLDPSGFRAANPEHVPRLNELIRRLAVEEGILVADHEAAFQVLDGLGPDGLHPNEIGYEVMADTWLAAIEALAASTGN